MIKTNLNPKYFIKPHTKNKKIINNYKLHNLSLLLHCHKFPSNDVHRTFTMYCKSTVYLFRTQIMFCKFRVYVPYSENVP